MLLALGLGKGSPAAIISRNCPEFLILEFALYKIGAVPVKINWRLSPREMIGSWTPAAPATRSCARSVRTGAESSSDTMAAASDSST